MLTTRCEDSHVAFCYVSSAYCWAVVLFLFPEVFLSASHIF